MEGFSVCSFGEQTTMHGCSINISVPREISHSRSHGLTGDGRNGTQTKGA